VNRSQTDKAFRAIIIIILVAGVTIASLGKPQQAQAAIAAGYSEYFLPGGSDQLMGLLDDNDSASAGTQLTNVITISVAVNNETVYFDHWENGYGNGITNADEIYHVSKGTVLTFKSTTIPYPRGTTLGACTGSTYPAGATLVGSSTGVSQATRCYDGRDRLYVVGGAVSVAQAFWPTTLNTNYANAWEVYPIKPYQTDYTIPVGENLCLGGNNTTTPAYIGSPNCGGGAASPYADFDNVYVLAQATYDGVTNITITSPAGGNLALKTATSALNRGEVTQLWHVNNGTTVHGDHPLQVQFIIGEDQVASAQNNSRSYTAVPSSLWSTQYYSPVPSFTQAGYTPDTDIYIYNPSASALTINYVDTTGSGTFSVAANSTEAYHDASNANRYVPVNSAVYLAAADGVTKFWAIGGVDVGSPTFNWGFSLIPPQTLTNEYYVSWAPGGWNQAGAGSPSASNYSPIYVTATHNGTTIFVDYSPTDGIVDSTYTLNRFHMQRIYDQTAGTHTGDADNTGVHIWANYPIALVYGEDAGLSQAASPGLDAGYTILPLNADWMDVYETVTKTATPSTIQTAIGQVVTFSIETDTNYPLSRIDVSDDLPNNWVYDGGTTKIYLDGSMVGINEPSPVGQHPAWNNVIPGGVNAGQKVIVEFQAHNTAVLTPGVIINTGTSSGTSPTGEVFTGEGTANVTVLGSLDLIATKINNTGGSAFVGIPFTWTITVNNQGTGTAANFSAGNTILVDNLPNTGASYSAGAVTSIGGTTGTINCAITAVLPFNLTCTAGTAVSIPANGAGFSLPVTVTPNATGVLTNPRGGAGNPTCMVDPNNNINPEADENNNTCSDSVTVTNSPAIIGNYVWNDANTNGIQEGGETGISGVTVNLRDSTGGSILQTTTTNASGAYSFTTGGGIYIVEFVKPAGYAATPQNQGANDAVDSDANIGTGLTAAITVAGGETDNTQDAGFYQPAVLGNFVWNDANGNGIQEAGESGLNGVTVNLRDSSGSAIIQTTTTGASGAYSFTTAPGTYILEFVKPTGYTASPENQGGSDAVDSDANAGTGLTAAITLAGGMTDNSQDAGFYLPATIGDFVWNDANGNGIQDPLETGINGVTVNLLDSSGSSVLQTVVTNASGAYSFTTSAGTYVLEFVKPSGYAASPLNLGGNDFLDSDANISTGRTAAITIAAGAADATQDAGFYLANGTISGQVRYDTDNDGVIADSESGLAGAQVSLWTDPNGDGDPSDGAQVQTTYTTTISGLYSFEGLPAGNYVIIETNPAGYTSTNDSAAPNNDRIRVTLPAGGTSANNDFLDTDVASISGQVRNDVDNDGNPADVETGIAVVTIGLYADDGTGKPSGAALFTTTTDGTGTYIFNNITPGNYVVQETNPAAFSSTYDKDGSLSNSLDQIKVVLLPGTNNSSNDFLDSQQLPQITVTKDANPTSVPETGSLVTFTYTVNNIGLVPVTITSLADDKFGTLVGDADCQVATILAAGASCSFDFTTNLAGPAASTHVNNFTVHVHDADGNDASNTDDATVTFTDVLPSITVTKDAAPTSVPETGGNVTFTYTILNSGSVPVAITSLADDVYGALIGDADCQIGTALAANAACSFSVIHSLSGATALPHVNVFTAHAQDTEGNDATDSDDATVTFTDVLPSITVTKDASPTSVPETGGSVTFTYTVQNSGPVEVKIFSLADDIFGTLAGDATCEVGTDLTPGSSCSFTATQTLSGAVASTHVDVFTAHALDTEDNDATDSDDATVTFTDVLPEIQVSKDANPTSVPENGGSVTFTYTVRNSGTVAVTITSLADDKFGVLSGDADCQVGTPLTPNLSCTFDYTTSLSGQARSTHTDIFTAHAQDAEGNDANAFDDAEVTFTDVLPEIEVIKDAVPSSIPATGADVTFTFTVRNTGSVPFTIKGLEDDVFGLLSGDADCQEETVLAAGSACSFTETHFLSGAAGTTHTDIFSARGMDYDENSVTDSDDAVVAFLVAAADFAVSKTNPEAYIYTGETTVYTVRVTNQGPSSVTGAILTDLPVPGLTKTSVACSATPGQCSTAPTVAELEAGTYALPKLDPSQYFEITINALVTATSGAITNTATVELPHLFTDPTPGNNTDDVIDPVGQGADLEVTKTDGVDSIQAGETLTYTVRITNHGPSSVTGAILSDAATAGLTKTGVTCTATPGQCTTPPTTTELESGTFVLPALAVNQFYEISVSAIVTATSGGVSNTATVTMPAGIVDPTPPNNIHTDTDPIQEPSPTVIPDTGFAPNRITPLPAQPEVLAYAPTNSLWLEIPSLGVHMAITGVPQLDGKWDVSWLGKQAGWLNGTAYPTDTGNSVLTGHVYLPNGKAGPFVYLYTLKWGDQIIIHAPDGQKYIYEVREVKRVLPTDMSAFKHEERSWTTLITCQGYNQADNNYKYRVVVRAVLISVKTDTGSMPK
jgi:LPXTG-site transpeptidase (sortase) family protein